MGLAHVDAFAKSHCTHKTSLIFFLPAFQISELCVADDEENPAIRRRPQEVDRATQKELCGHEDLRPGPHRGKADCQQDIKGKNATVCTRQKKLKSVGPISQLQYAFQWCLMMNDRRTVNGSEISTILIHLPSFFACHVQFSADKADAGLLWSEKWEKEIAQLFGTDGTDSRHGDEESPLASHKHIRPKDNCNNFLPVLLL